MKQILLCVMTAALAMAGCAKDDDGNRGNLPPLPDPTDVCSGISSIYCKPTTPPDLGRSVFNGIASDAVIYVPRASLEAYKNAIYYNGCSSEVVGYDF